jgi:hypothetical protein
VRGRLLGTQPVAVDQEVDQRISRRAGGDSLPERGTRPVDAEVLGLFQVEYDDLAVELAPFEAVPPQS